MSESYADGLDAGLRAAARCLISTAVDYEQMAERKAAEQPAMDVPGLRAAIQNEARGMREKAALLRGQAQRIQEL